MNGRARAIGVALPLAALLLWVPDAARAQFPPQRPNIPPLVPALGAGGKACSRPVELR